MERQSYLEVLYPFQDDVLRVLSELDTGFYLTGGTAASRGYLHHRFSDDLDLFTNDSPDFSLWTDRIVQALLGQEDWTTEVTQRERRFVRLSLRRHQTLLKVEMIDDVPSHIGEIQTHPVLGRLDSPENILANKVSALMDREEPKDLADIWGFCCRLDLSLSDAIEGAQGKAAGIFPADLARLLCTAQRKDWELVRWIDAPDADRFLLDLAKLGEELLLV